MMNKDSILNALNDEIIAKFKTAIEIGKWENGEKLTQDQLATCMQAVMVWEHEHLPANLRTGYVQKPIENGQVVGQDCDVEHDRHYPNTDVSDDYQQNIAKLLTGQYAMQQAVKFKN